MNKEKSDSCVACFIGGPADGQFLRLPVEKLSKRYALPLWSDKSVIMMTNDLSEEIPQPQKAIYALGNNGNYYFEGIK